MAANGRPAGRSGAVQSVGKAFDLLDAFRVDGPVELPLRALASHAAVPKSTAHGLAQALVAEGALVRTPGGYRLGLRLFELGERVRAKRDLREAALPFLQDLYQATHLTVHLAVIQGADVVYLDRIRGHGGPKLPSALGGRLPAHGTGVGKALLSGCDDVDDRLGPGPYPAMTPYTITVPAVLTGELERIRAQGVAFDREEATLGLHCVAAPISVAGRVVAALSVSGAAHDVNVDRLVVAVRAAANGVGRSVISSAAR